ncbi:helix-turn-helix domain-containing protein [Lacrimispora sp. 210928-DFI.3.58]|uniref:helix-turn-helix domain-containing protein n=1 Tax=Lacrimispora sp. 210928-DFI.3.58 TaxID=2883214 RepID=UPI001D0779E2|nr:AraC family transcriptional regulator [Lacrimispora sp. 210928-DFI.3.58]MCB7320680.1 helix-turn-helix domain-containing protein [Lacrimispora sp. 210928-DFI.3.58]
MAKFVPTQSSYCSMQDENKICSFDIEVLTGPTEPLLHSMSRFWLINSGEGTLRLNNRSYHIKPGAVFSVLPWQISEITEVVSPIQLFVVAYYFDTVNEIIKAFYNPGSRQLSIIQALMKSPVLYLEGSQLESVRTMFLSIKEELGMESTMDSPSSQSPGWELRNLFITNKLIEILICFMRAEKMVTAALKQTIEPCEIFHYLYSHLNEKITLAKLSKIFYMSESSISAYITSTTGLSFFDLLNEMRIGKTINFLLYTDFTLEELAEILGFVDSSHISKVFLARMGMKANEFRNIYQNIGDLCRIKDRRDFYTMISYIYRHYSENLSPKLLCDRFRISPTELNQILLYQVEMNFSDYLNFIRVNRASELLLESTKSIMEIAIEVGYNTEKTLTRNFLKFRSMTPGKFRQSIRLQTTDWRERKDPYAKETT